MTQQTVTRAKEFDLEPGDIYRKLTQASLIPSWAPAFADRVEHVRGTSYRVVKGQEVFDLELIANEVSLTVDYLRSMVNGKHAGAYIRITPRPLCGSAVTMTVPVGPNTSPDKVAEEVEQELAALAALA